MASKIVPLKGRDRYYTARIFTGEYVIDRLRNKNKISWPKVWGLENYKEAHNLVKKLNSGRYKLSFFRRGLKKVV